MTTFNTNTDVNARGHQLTNACDEAEARVWRFVIGLPALFARPAADPVEAVEKMERREAARRAVDSLLR